jgi:uncharacterized protein
MDIKMKYCRLLAAFSASMCFITNIASAAARVEVAICKNQNLIAIDDALDINYTETMAADIGEGARKSLKKSQLKWIKERNKCHDDSCITNAYVARIDFICRIPVYRGMRPLCAAPRK